jgi:hypothetical protein
MSGLEQELLEMLEVQKTFKAEEERIKRVNAQKIKSAEDQIRLLNTTLPIQQMKGEPDEVYRERLIALRVPVDNSRVDATEARMYEHKLFKRNLKKLIDLPLYQVENIIKMLDLNDMDRTYQLNEIFPKVETEFIKVFGNRPLLRNPEQTLTDFFISILEAPLLAQEQTEAISALSQQQAVTSGEIDPILKSLKKAEVLKLLKEAGLTKGRAQEFQKMTVNKLKVLYTEHLQKTRKRSATEQSQAEAFGFLSQLGESRKQIAKERRKFQMEALKSRIKEAEQAERDEDREIEAQRKRELKMMREEEKISRKGLKQPKRRPKAEA